MKSDLTKILSLGLLLGVITPSASFLNAETTPSPTTDKATDGKDKDAKKKKKHKKDDKAEAPAPAPAK